MSLVFTQLGFDNFHRPNEEPLNPVNWSNPIAEPLSVLSNTCAIGITDSGNFGLQGWVGNSTPNNQYASFTVNVWGAHSSADLYLRSDSGFASHYYDLFLGVTGVQWFVEIFNFSTMLGTANLSRAPQNGDIFLGYALGSNIGILYNGVQVLSVTDPSPIASGITGIDFTNTAVRTDTSLSLFATGSVSVPVILPYSVPDCRNYGQFPNNSISVNQTLTYTVPAHPSVTPPVDSRTSKPVASGTYPQNSRTPGTFGPGE